MGLESIKRCSSVRGVEGGRYQPNPPRVPSCNRDKLILLTHPNFGTTAGRRRGRGEGVKGRKERGKAMRKKSGRGRGQRISNVGKRKKSEGKREKEGRMRKKRRVRRLHERIIVKEK